ncbi:sensor histidine kinase [Clostridium sp. 'White wine YQ']|uniref:sensor histidine kinase n=1 Tax=Clostridium sp. 'White wine YQ' TaxID=3027474 RepID=UPI0023650057|nr:sensor histidine kinase [Clostridium sp. 'White wine YQ']MDD7794347.1 sensor histidine kinase [Clostridium sp. 'White wine YQ']
MKFTKYLADRKFTLLFYALLMLFISLVIFLDGSKKVNVENVLYINLVSLTFFIIYLIAGYLRLRDYYKNLNNIVENNSDEIMDRLMAPKTHEQILHHEVLKALFNEQSSKILSLQEHKKDYEEFITSWVHQVKTPISASRLLIENNAKNPSKEILYSLEEEIDKIENYIEQALYYSKIDDFSKDYLINELELDRLVKEGVKKQAKTFINKKINIEIENTELIVTTDKKWLAFIVDQILANSLKYTSMGGRIKVYGMVEEKAQKLVIDDNGIGIKEEDLHRVFDKGFTGYNGRENYKSTGMGLYLSKKLARKLGHDITIESKYGEYTRVTIVFPKLIDYYEVSED